MKYIFDFDDVLFHTVKRRKEHMYPKLEKMGISITELDEYYEKARGSNFSLKKMLAHFSFPKDFYEEIMREVEDFKNKELIAIIKNLGKLNCYIVTAGDEEFQLDKIKRVGIAPLFSGIIIASASKKEAIEKICVKHKDEEVLFIDDKAHNFEDLDFKKYPNLKTILYDEYGLEKLEKQISMSR